MGTPVVLPDETEFWLWDSLDVLEWGLGFMSKTLFNLTYEVARELGVVLEGTATGGSTTTIIDTVERTEVDDLWNLGCAWIIRDAGGAGAAPEGEYSVITDFANATSTVTLRSTLTAAVAVGDKYAIARKISNTNWIDIITQKINQALMDLGPIPVIDITSITIAADQTEYLLPLAAKQDLRQVWLQTIDDDTNDNRWEEIRTWRVDHAAAGVQDTLVLSLQYPEGYDLKLIYVANHAEIRTSTAKLSEYVPPERVIYPAIRDCFIWQKERTGWDKFDTPINYWTRRCEQIKSERPIIWPRKQGRLLVLGGHLSPTDDAPNKVSLW